MTWTLALGLLKRFYGPVAVVAAAFFAWMLFGAISTGHQLRKDLNKTTKELASTKQKLADAEVAFSDLVRDYNEQARIADARERALEQQRLTAVDKVRGEYGTRVAQLDRSLQLALDSLRYSADEDRRRALKPAADSPTACAGYAARPTDLDVRHSEFLVRLADRADRVAVQLGACQQYVSEIVLRSQPPK